MSHYWLVIVVRATVGPDGIIRMVRVSLHNWRVAGSRSLPNEEITIGVQQLSLVMTASEADQACCEEEEEIQSES